MATIFQINMSKGGVPKTPIHEAQVNELGIVGDVQKDKRYHGGPNRALCLFALELIQQLQAEGHPIYSGSTGENITTQGLDFSSLKSGDQLQLGEILIEITRDAPPCKTIKDSFSDQKSTRISAKIHPGESRLYAKVLETGTIRVGDPIVLVK